MRKELTVKTHEAKAVIDITDLVNQELGGFGNGLCNVTVQHTTCAVTCADMDPGTDQDYLDALYGMVPKLQFRHPHNPAHAPDHILSALVGPSVSLPVTDGALVLGTWQRLVLMEFDGPRERTMVLTFIESE